MPPHATFVCSTRIQHNTHTHAHARNQPYFIYILSFCHKFYTLLKHVILQRKNKHSKIFWHGSLHMTHCKWTQKSMLCWDSLLSDFLSATFDPCPSMTTPTLGPWPLVLLSPSPSSWARLAVSENSGGRWRFCRAKGFRNAALANVAIVSACCFPNVQLQILLRWRSSFSWVWTPGPEFQGGERSVSWDMAASPVGRDLQHESQSTVVNYYNIIYRKPQ